MPPAWHPGPPGGRYPRVPAARGVAGSGRPVRPTADPRDKEQTVPGENLTRQEAAERAALVAVESYDVDLDLTRGDRVFASRTTITFTARDGASTFVDLIADAVHEIELNRSEERRVGKECRSR